MTIIDTFIDGLFTGNNIFNIDLSNWLGRLNFFSDINLFHALYDWLPSDIAGACEAIIIVSLVLFVFGLIDKVVFL